MLFNNYCTQACFWASTFPILYRGHYYPEILRQWTMILNTFPTKKKQNYPIWISNLFVGKLGLTNLRLDHINSIKLPKVFDTSNKITEL